MYYAEKEIKFNMDAVKVFRCQGNGQGSCLRCSENGKWNREWMCFLYTVDSLPGCYCSDCVKQICDERGVVPDYGFEKKCRL